jgi:hypothetical protein
MRPLSLLMLARMQVQLLGLMQMLMQTYSRRYAKYSQPRSREQQ